MIQGEIVHEGSRVMTTNGKGLAVERTPIFGGNGLHYLIQTHQTAYSVTAKAYTVSSDRFVKSFIYETSRTTPVKA